MKLSDKMIEFIHGPNSIFLGTRSDKLIPHVKWIIGAIVEKDQESITCYLLECLAQPVLENTGHNGSCALFVSHLVSHESYQFKGTFISVRPCNENDEAIKGIYFQKFGNFLMHVGVSEANLSNLATGPAVAVTFRVEEVYDQSPRPGAGQKINS